MPDTWTHYHPVRIISGPGCIQKVASHLKGNPWLLLTSPGFTRRGTTDRLKALVSPHTLQVHDQVEPNPDLDHLDQLTRHYRQNMPRGILALGGGSVLDTAKVLSLTLPCSLDNPLHAVLRQGEEYSWNTSLEVIALPATAGTGAEVTPFATVWDRLNNKKHSISSELAYPELALLDPELTLSLPHKQTLYPGLDAVSHALESLWNKNATAISTAYAWQALSLALENLPDVLDDPGNLASRQNMQHASLLAGLAISRTKTAIAHSISYPLTSHYQVPHGLACSFTLPRLLDRHLESLADTPWKKELLQDLQAFLSGLDLDSHIEKYATQEQILSLQDHMLSKDRADNYIFHPTPLEQIIRP